MLRNAVAPATCNRPGWIAIGLVVGTLSATAAFAQQPPAPAAPAQPAAAAPNPFVFNGDAGAIMNFVKADKTADFEMVLGKLKEALAKSEKPERKQQAAGWKVLKASEPGAEYSVGNILVEAFGAEGQALYKTYSEAYGTPAIGALLHLSKVTELGK